MQKLEVNIRRLSGLSFTEPVTQVGESDTIRHIYDRVSDARSISAAIGDIATGAIVGCQFHGFFSPEECTNALALAAAHPMKERYAGATDVGRIGRSLFETQFGPEWRKGYFANATANSAASRALFGGARYPMDLIRALVDEGAPHCSSLLRINGECCAFGLVRYQDPGSEILTHVDDARWDVPDSIETQQIESQITVLVFLSATASGGETTIFPQRLNLMQYNLYRLPAPNDYAIDDQMLVARPLVIKPKQGDVVLFEARYPHKVSAPVGGARYTVSGFIGVCRDGRWVMFS